MVTLFNKKFFTHIENVQRCFTMQRCFTRCITSINNLEYEQRLMVLQFGNYRRARVDITETFQILHVSKPCFLSYGLTSFPPDGHLVLCWPVECSVMFQSDSSIYVFQWMELIPHLIAADISCHRWMFTIIYREEFMQTSSVFCSVALVCADCLFVWFGHILYA